MTGQPQPASLELVALAVKVRPDWTADDVWAALARAHGVGMTWPQVLVVLTRLMADPGSRPDELTHEGPKPWRTPPPGDYARGVALARAAYRTAHPITSPPEGEQQP